MSATASRRPAKSEDSSSGDEEDIHGAETPYVLEIEARAEHRYTMIILHGQLSNREAVKEFYNDFKRMPVMFGPTSNPPSDDWVIKGDDRLIDDYSYEGWRTLPHYMAHTRFVVPIAPRRPCAQNQGKTFRQWFDFASAREPQTRPDMTVDGFKECYMGVTELINKEAELVPMDNIFLGGFGDGGAMCLGTLITMIDAKETPRIKGDGANERVETLGGVFSINGWLPHHRQMVAVVNERLDLPQSDTMQLSQEQKEIAAKEMKAAKELLRAWTAVGGVREPLAQLIELCGPSSGRSIDAFLKRPLLLMHAEEDEVVPLHNHHETAEALRKLGFRSAEEKTYEDESHQISGQMLARLLEWSPDRPVWLKLE